MKGNSDTIAAVATGTGGALGVIRLSGPSAVEIADAVFRRMERPTSGAAGLSGAATAQPGTQVSGAATSGPELTDAPGYTLHHGEIYDPASGTTVDEVVVSLFRAPRSFSGEDTVEISCHGSRYIQQRIMELLLRHGARTATAGEFTLRAFLAGKLDLAQAEAVADMIASTDRATHAMAMNQMRGGYSAEFSILRDELVTLVSLLELELDFGEEDVEFADRTRLETLMLDTREKIDRLAGSFSLGNVLKEGVAVAIVGSPNVGKSTLLNTLLNDDRVMVSDIAGTTRDVIEETLVIGGVKFRFLDTAGIRHTDDPLEKMGIERTHTSIGRANIVLLMVEARGSSGETLDAISEALNRIALSPGQELCILINKIDKPGVEIPGDAAFAGLPVPADIPCKVLAVSAKRGENIDGLVEYLSSAVDTATLDGSETIVSNSRHFEALHHAAESLSRAIAGLAVNLPADLLAQDIRETIHHLGTITGAITTDEILANIFSKFCIGK